MIADDKSFVEHDRDMHSVNVLDFPGYENKLKHAVLNSRETEGVVCGSCTIGSYPCCLFVMESGFMMGSMGSVVGEKITRLFEYATKHSLPVIATPFPVAPDAGRYPVIDADGKNQRCGQTTQ